MRPGATRVAAIPLRDLVDRFGGQCGGDLSRRVVGFAALEHASDLQLAFVSGARYRASVEASKASAVLVSATDAALVPEAQARLWVCGDPYLQFARIAQHFESLERSRPAAGIDASATVDASAVVASSASIGPRVVLGAGVEIGDQVEIGAGTVVGEGSRIGDGTRLHAGVIVYAGCSLGARCIVHSGAVIGADGFGFAKDGPRWVKIPQVGGVVVGDDVEIGANTTIDRGALDDTVIGNGVKLDNQIQVGHNVRIGDDTIMAACVGIAGSATIGKRCQIGGAARIMGHVTIVDDAVVSTQTFVSRSITKPGQYTGYYPMAEHAAFEKSAAVLRRLDTLRQRVRQLEARDRGTATSPAPAASSSSAPTIDSSEPESPA